MNSKPKKHQKNEDDAPKETEKEPDSKAFPFIFNPENGAGGIRLQSILAQPTPIETAAVHVKSNKKSKRTEKNVSEILGLGGNDSYVIPAVFLSHTI